MPRAWCACSASMRYVDRIPRPLKFLWKKKEPFPSLRTSKMVPSVLAKSPRGISCFYTGLRLSERGACRRDGLCETLFLSRVPEVLLSIHTALQFSLANIPHRATALRALSCVAPSMDEVDECPRDSLYSPHGDNAHRFLTILRADSAHLPFF